MSKTVMGWGVAVLGAVLVSTSSQAETLTCSYPINSVNTAQDLLTNFAGGAFVEDVAGAEGETHKAIVVYPSDKRRRLEVSFWDEAMTRPSGVGLGVRAKAWSVAGLNLGASLAAVEKANGKPFVVSGFDWDYGGYVVDFDGGALSKLGCRLSLRFSPRPNTSAPAALEGERKIRSNNPKLVKLAPQVTTIALGWPDPDRR